MRLQLPSTLTAHAVWPPQSGTADEPWIVYVQDRRYRRVGLSALVATYAYLAWLVLWHGSILMVLPPLVLALAGAAIPALGGGAGFYFMGSDGVLRDRISTTAPRSLLVGRTKARTRKGLVPDELLPSHTYGFLDDVLGAVPDQRQHTAQPDHG